MNIFKKITHKLEKESGKNLKLIVNFAGIYPPPGYRPDIVLKIKEKLGFLKDKKILEMRMSRESETGYSGYCFMFDPSLQKSILYLINHYKNTLEKKTKLRFDFKYQKRY